MPLLRWMASLWLVVGLTCTPVMAQDIGNADRAAIAGQIEAFDAIMKAGRMADSLDFVPPRLLRAIAGTVGLPEAEFKAMVGASIADAIKGATFVSFGMDMAAAVVGITPDRSRSYMLIPTESVIALPQVGRLLSKTSTLALKDEDQWYLVRVDNAAQIVILKDVYPEFARVEFPTGSTAAID